jgi:hypothetical protein
VGTALKLAIEKAAGLPEAAQEELGRELLVRIDTLRSFARKSMSAFGSSMPG